MCSDEDRKALQLVIKKTAQDFIGYQSKVSISDIGEVRCPRRAERILKKKKKHPHQPQLVHPAATWQEIQKYQLQYHQTTDHLLSSGCVHFI